MYISSFSLSKRGVGPFHSGSTSKIRTTTEDIAIFEKGQPVSLEIPDRLFGSAFSLVTNLSTTVGDYILNSSMRLATGLHTLQPLLKKFGKGNNLVIEAYVDDKPVFKDNKIRK